MAPPQPRFIYTYICAPSSETRGRRPGHDLGCGAMLVRTTKREIVGKERPQGSPCPFCGKRTRLNEGLVYEWYDIADARLHASEYNLAVGVAEGQIGGEQSGE